MSDYDDGWNEGYELGKKSSAKRIDYLFKENTRLSIESAKWLRIAQEFERENEELKAVIQRMLPKLREHFTEEYIFHELIKGGG